MTPRELTPLERALDRAGWQRASRAAEVLRDRAAEMDSSTCGGFTLEPGEDETEGSARVHGLRNRAASYRAAADAIENAGLGLTVEKPLSALPLADLRAAAFRLRQAGFPDVADTIEAEGLR